MTAPTPKPDDVDPTNGPATEPPEVDTDPPGDDGDAPPADLGDAGKKALDAMKAKWKAAEAARKKAESDLAAANLANSKDDAARATEQARQEATTAATQKANARIVRSEVKAAATGKLADPKDAITFLDLAQFEVDDDGEIDSDAVAQAIDGLLKAKPYLAAATGNRFKGTGDNGAAGRTAGGKKQVTEAELKTMSPDQIVAAQADGRLVNLMTGKN
jgi:hypothetical protein